MTSIFKNITLTFGLVLVLGGYTACQSTGQFAQVALLPQPTQLEIGKKMYRLPKHCKIGIADSSLTNAACYLKGLLTPATGYDFSIVEGKGDVCLSIDKAMEGKSGTYEMSVSSRKVKIIGNTYQGVIAGIQTLRQLLPDEIEFKEPVKREWMIPSVEIKDSPRFDWRGLMLDVSRHFFTVDEVKECLDLMALYKMNKFHWHLTDDPGWRVEIKRYPLLSEKGAWRHFNHLDQACMASASQNPDYNLPMDERIKVMDGDTLYGGYYTQKEIREVVAYAAQRGIDIIPEIDMPGHMQSAVDQYPYIACGSKDSSKVPSSPVCPGKEETLDFCKNVYREIFSLFPYEYVHIGGDEVNKTNWNNCPRCQQRISEEGLKSPEELQSWFNHQMEKFFNEHHRKMIGWDEIMEGGLSGTSTVMWWRADGKEVPRQTAQHGNTIIFTPTSRFYLDYGQDASSVSKIYDYEPYGEMADSAQQQLILGVQGNIWTEYIPSRDRMLYMAYPRALAIAELGWSRSPKDWRKFSQRMARQLGRLQKMDVNYRLPDLEGIQKNNEFVGDTILEVTCIDPNVSIHYTTDGSVPTLSSPKYTGKIKVTETTDFTFRTFRPNGKGDTVVSAHYEKKGN